MNDREAIDHIHRRLDKQDATLDEVRDLIKCHISESTAIKPALEELVVLWRGSKVLLPILAALATSAWAFYTWAKDHIV